MSMHRAQIERVSNLCRAVVDACDLALQQLDTEVQERHERHPEIWGGKPRADDHSYGSAATATLRRRSMDLTRALAEMRRR